MWDGPAPGARLGGRERPSRLRGKGSVGIDGGSWGFAWDTSLAVASAHRRDLSEDKVSDLSSSVNVFYC